jgi:putative flippase GtrA
MAVYYPLTLLFRNDVTFLGQHFYLPPFVISSLVAITSNYTMNKHWTFNDRKPSKLSYSKYLSMGLVTLLLDIFLLFVFVDFVKLTPVLAAALAIAIAFIIRFIASDKWIWRK